MATIHTCDHESHGAEQVEAVASVQLKKMDEKQKNTINTVKAKDACQEHVGDLAAAAFRSGSLDKLFHSVDILAWRRAGD